METVVVAFEGEKNGRRLKELLESSGTAACLLCRSADQVKRLVRQQRLTAVVCGYKFPDGTAEELAGELPGFCTVLLLAPRGLLELVPELQRLLKQRLVKPKTSAPQATHLRVLLKKQKTQQRQLSQQVLLPKRPQLKQVKLLQRKKPNP